MKKKIISICLVICLLAVAIVGGTLAYFTDTDEADNVFTVGNIDIELHEKNRAGVTDEAYREWLESETIMPGETMDKIVWVKNVGKEPAYVRVTITVPADMTPVWNTASGWSISNPSEGKWVCTSTEPLAAGAETPELLTGVTLKSEVTDASTADTYNVNVYVDAIQAASFENNSAAAYAALDGANVSKATFASTITEANEQLATANASVKLTEDLNSTKAVAMGAEAVLDGNGKTITKTAAAATPSTGNAGVNTSGGTIKNVTVTGDSNEDGKSFRAVYATSGLASDLVIEGAKLNSAGGYAININVPASMVGKGTLIIKDSELNGWVSYGAIANAEISKTSFGGANTSADGLALDTFRPYADTVLTECSFAAGYNFSAGSTPITITLNDCKVGGVPVTAADFATLFEVDDALKACTVIVDGVTVTF